MKHRILVIACAILFLLSLPLWSQTSNYRENVSKRGSTVASFLEIGVGARALSMGSAFTAVSDDPSAIYWNIAGIAKMGKNGVFFNHTEWLADTRFEYLGGVFQLGRLGALGISLTALTMDDMEVTTVDMPEGTDQMFSAGDYAVSIGYAVKLTDRFAIGFNPKIIHQYIWAMSATGVAMDIGVHYDTPFKNIILGFSMTNFGQKMQMVGDNARVLYDPDILTSGDNDRIAALLETKKWALPLNFKIGLMYNAINTVEHKLIFALDAQHPNNDYESINLGMEYIFNKRFAIRGGYKSMFLEDSEESFTLGAGVNHAILGNIMMHFDFAYADFGLLEDVQKYSIAIDF